MGSVYKAFSLISFEVFRHACTRCGDGALTGAAGIMRLPLAQLVACMMFRSRSSRFMAVMAALLLTGAAALADRMAFEWAFARLTGDFHGWKVQRDAGEGVRFLRIAALYAHPRAEYLLGLAHAHGEGAVQDDPLAEAWFLRASEHGHAQARYHLAWMYYKGEGVVRNRPRGLELMAQAADQGMPEARAALARMREAVGKP